MLLLKPDIHTSRTGCLQIEFCRAVTAHFYSPVWSLVFPCRSPLRIRFKPDLPVYRIKKSICSSMLWTDSCFSSRRRSMQHADAVSSTVSAATKQKRHKISQTLSSRPCHHDSLHILSLRKAFLIRCIFLQISSIPREISSSLLPQEKNTTSGFSASSVQILSAS